MSQFEDDDFDDDILDLDDDVVVTLDKEDEDDLAPFSEDRPEPEPPAAPADPDELDQYYNYGAALYGAIVNSAAQDPEIDKKVDAAKAKMRDAFDNGESEDFIRAQDEMIALERQRFGQASLDPRNIPRPPPPPRLARWQKDNPWYGEDEPMTAYALAVDAQLIKSGVTPDKQEYWSRLDAQIRQAFPGKAGRQKQDRRPRSGPSPGTAPHRVRQEASRGAVTLSADDVAFCKRMNIPLKDYARQRAADAKRGNQ